MKNKWVYGLLPLLLLIIFLITSFYVKLSYIPIRIWDEARLANNALNMHLNGNWIVTYYENAPDMWNTKPPLLIWLQVISMKIFGVGEWAVRFPSATASILTGLFLFFFCKGHLGNTWIGFLSGSVLASTMAYVIYHAGRTGDYDALLALFTTCYCFAFYLFNVHGTKKWMYIFWAFVALAVLTKSVAGLFFLPGLFIFTAVQKNLKKVFTSRATYIGFAGFIIVVGAYYLARESVNPGYLQAVYENELGGRFLTTLEENKGPFEYYEDNMRKWRYRYWYLFFLPACIINFFHRSKAIKRLTLFNLLMIYPYLIIISSAQTKLEWYDIPVYSFTALQIGILLFTAWQFIKKYLDKYKLNPAPFAVLLFALVFFKPTKQASAYIHDFKERWWDVEIHAQGYFLQDAIKQNKNLNNYVFCYEGYNAQIMFYITKLQSENHTVELQGNTENLSPGKFVVANQDVLKKQIEENYVTEKKEEKAGCTVYFIISKR